MGGLKQGGGQDVQQLFNFGDQQLMQLLGELPFPGGVLPVQGGFLGQDPGVGGLPRTQSSLVDAARRFAFEPTPIGEGVLGARDEANRLFGGNLEQTLAALQRSIPRAEEIAETGLRTQLPSAALDRQLQDQLAQFREEFSGFRGGTDLAFIGSDAITRSDERRALAQAQLDELASGRKAASQGLPGQLAALLTQLPQTLGQGLAGFDQTVRGLQESLTRRPLDVFQELRGMVQPGGFFQQGFPATDPTAQLLGSLAQAIPQLGGLFPQQQPQAPFQGPNINPQTGQSTGGVGDFVSSGPQQSGGRLGIPDFLSSFRGGF